MADGLQIVKQPTGAHVHVDGVCIGVVQRVDDGFRCVGLGDALFVDFQTAVIYMAGRHAGERRREADRVTDVMMHTLGQGRIVEPKP